MNERFKILKNYLKNRRVQLPDKIDLHMHSTVSDGTDSPSQILAKVRANGIGMFALTDHDAVKGCRELIKELKAGGGKEAGDDKASGDAPDKSGSGLRFLPGVEFSCRDDLGKYHILGYGYDPDSGPINDLVDKAHRMRLEKVRLRLDFIRKEFGFDFSEEELAELFARDNPGKPHIAQMMIGKGYASSKEEAMKEYINKAKIKDLHVRPEEAIEHILGSGGIPVLAHPVYGDGDQFISGDDLENRVRRLADFGLQGLEAYYSGYTPLLEREIVDLTRKHWLLATAGSDYHGRNKMVALGDTNLDSVKEACPALLRFLETVWDRTYC